MKDLRKYLDKKAQKAQKKQVKKFKKFIKAKVISAAKKGDTETDIFYKGKFVYISLPASFDVTQYIESLGLTCKVSENFINISW